MSIFGLIFLPLASLKSLAVARLCLRFLPSQGSKSLTQNLYIYLIAIPKRPKVIKR